MSWRWCRCSTAVKVSSNIIVIQNETHMVPWPQTSSQIFHTWVMNLPVEALCIEDSVTVLPPGISCVCLWPQDICTSSGSTPVPNIPFYHFSNIHSYTELLEHFSIFTSHSLHHRQTTFSIWLQQCVKVDIRYCRGFQSSSLEPLFSKRW